MEKVGKDRLLKVIDESVQGGVNLVQVREKRLTEETLKNLVLDVVDVVDGRAFLAVNSSLEASQLPGVDFLHLPESESGLVRSYSDSFGQSTHSLPMAQRAQQNGANYVFVGSVFPTQSHPGEGSIGTIFLKEYNLSEPGLHKLIHIGFRLLNLKTFFTGGPIEVRAWTIKQGSSALEAAGQVHTDFQRGFIKAEVFKYNDLVRLGSEKAVKETGLAKLQGCDYAVDEGDCIYFHFNV